MKDGADSEHVTLVTEGATARAVGASQDAPSTGQPTLDDPLTVQVRSVARVFKIFGWFWVIIYTPIVVTCIGSLFITLAGHRIESPLVLAGASLFNGAILALAVLYVTTGRRISKRDVRVRRRALLLSCFMMLGFPILSIVGIICYRNIAKHLKISGIETS